MQSASYLLRRGELQTYFDRTALEAWTRLTSDAPVSRIRATVRAGRDAMRATILDMLPSDLTGARILDAGCGTGALALAMAERGAEVVAIDLSPQLVALARDRTAAEGRGRILFLSGDMLDPALGRFDHAVAMDSLIHYRAPDMVGAVAGLAARVSRSVVFTYAPRTPALALMHATGKLFPRADRSPAIEPVAGAALARRLVGAAASASGGWRLGRTQRITSGFYVSAAQEVLIA